jgi:hypothetical protein
MHLEGEVQLLDTNYKPWWVLRKLSRHDDDVINFDADDAEDVHSFPAAARTYYPHARTIALLLLADAVAVGTGTSGPSGDPVA